MTEDPSLSHNAAVKRIGPRIGIVPDTLRGRFPILLHDNAWGREETTC